MTTFSDIKASQLNQIRSEEIKELVVRSQELTQGGYDLYDQNYKVLSSILKKLLKLTKQEKEWYLYFYALYDLLYLNVRDNNYAEIVKYAEIYYKDSARYMDKELPNYPGTGMACLNVGIYHDIFDAYCGYYQIDDARMDAFMKRYEEAVFKYGQPYFYYIDEMALGMLYHDAGRAEKMARNFLVYEKEIKSCYVCSHMEYLFHFLLVGQVQKAEELMLDLIHKNIPKKHLWCYKYCQRAEPDSMYISVMATCVECGKKEEFLYFYEKYWKMLPVETQLDTEGSEFQRLMCVFGGHFDNLENDIEQVIDDINEVNKDTTVNNMYAFLNWWCYFALLDRSGVHSVKIQIPGLETDEAGTVDSLAVSGYMEDLAAAYGRKFSQVRAQFDYDFVKTSYEKCFLQVDEA